MLRNLSVVLIIILMLGALAGCSNDATSPADQNQSSSGVFGGEGKLGAMA